MENKEAYSLKGKLIIVLGGSAGIGFATAQAAAIEGAQVVIVSSNQSRVNQALAMLPEGTKGYAVDLSQEENIKAFFEQIGSFDHLVYTAGENISLNLLNETNIEMARQYFNIRYWGAVQAVKYGAPHINQGGSICLTGGIANERPGSGWSLGASICGAMQGFARAMAVELSPIRVNIVSPGVVKTNLWSSMAAEDRESLYQSTAERLPAKRIGEAADLALTYIYLMKQPFATGQTIIVDGGAVLV